MASERSVDEADGDSLLIRFMKAQRRSAQLIPFARLSRSLTVATWRMARSQTDLPEGKAEAYLRRQIALRYIVTGFTVPIDEIVVTSGAPDALTLCLQALTRPGDTIAMDRPAFHAVQGPVRRLHLKAVEIPVDPRRGRVAAASSATLLV
jgi:DNA-binding transcriptional MocR family regulator